MKNKSGKLLMTIGLLLLAAALVLTGYNIWDEHRAQGAVSAVMEHLPQPEAGQMPANLFHGETEMPTAEIDGRRYIGRLSIPVIGLDLPVLSEWSSSNGKIAPCRYQGSAYANDFIIAGHNYRSHFGALKRVMVGDQVQFTDVNGNRFDYTVAVMEILEGTAVEEMEAGSWDLTLFTCTYGGQTRLTLRCVA